jgi:hypothetical protein
MVLPVSGLLDYHHLFDLPTARNLTLILTSANSFFSQAATVID